MREKGGDNTRIELHQVKKNAAVSDEEFSEVEGGADTLAGLLLELKGDFPGIHERITYKNYLFEILAIEERRISRVKLEVQPASAIH